MKKGLLFLFLFTTGLFINAQPVVGFTPYINSGLSSLVDIVNAKDASSRLFFVQQNGIVRVQSGGTLLATPFLNMSGLITYDAGGERGLLSLAFHPQFSTNGYFFVFYNNIAGNTELAQYHISADANVADAASRKILLTITKPFSNHNGCKLIFGTDGNLYFGTGDGGSGDDPQNNAQTQSSLLGKMLRINVDNFATSPYYTIPASNPLIGVAGARAEIYGWGLRNPWRWSFDRQTGDMWIADVGQNAWEEVNMIPAANTNGLNYGWRCFEATHSYITSLCGSTPAAGKTFPIFEYAHNSTGGYSITGGYVYRGAEFTTLQGYYICCDYVTTNGWLIKRNTDGTTNAAIQQTNFPAHISCFGEAEDGTLYAGSLDGPVYKVIVTGSLPVKLLSFSGRFNDSRDILNWTTTIDPSLSRFEIEQSDNGTRFETVGSQVARNSGSTAAYTFTAQPGNLATRFYRLKMIYADGKIQYSAIVKISSNQLQQISVSYNSARQIQLSSPYDLKSVTVVNLTGQKMYSLANVKAGNRALSTDNFISGLYVVNCITTDGHQQQFKVMIQ